MPKPKQNSFSLKRTVWLAAASGMPGLLTTLLLLVLGDYSTAVWISVLYLLVFFWLVLFLMLQDSIRRPWQVLSNILAAFGERDYSMRGTNPDPDDSIGLAMWETNRLADQLQEERRIRLEQHKLFDKVLQETDIAVFCFDPSDRLVIVNPYAARLYGKAAEKLLGQSLDELGLKFAVDAAYATGHQHKFPKRESRWLVKQGMYREAGRPHRLILLADIQETLREEEKGAWRKLTRVLGHELINSMTPMKTMAATMARIVKQDQMPDDWKEDFEEGCRVIADRVDNMSRFVRNYSQIAKQPEPVKKEFSMLELAQRLNQVELFRDVKIEAATDVLLNADEAQIEQVLINLLKNAVEASEGNPLAVKLGWHRRGSEGGEAVIQILDEGYGISNPDNLFVPYFTTKSGGNGIGLIISRQIVEAHGGSLNLENRKDRQGCRAVMVLPVK